MEWKRSREGERRRALGKGGFFQSPGPKLFLSLVSGCGIYYAVSPPLPPSDVKINSEIRYHGNVGVGGWEEGRGRGGGRRVQVRCRVSEEERSERNKKKEKKGKRGPSAKV